MSGYRSTMSSLYWGNPTYSGSDPKYAITIEWTWPTGGYWTRFQIIRTTRSPAAVIDDGIRLITRVVAGSQIGSSLPEGDTRDNWNFYRESTGNPIYRDTSPPPGEWVYYTLFVLDSHRVWVPVESVCEMSPKDHGWTRRLPELLPGVSVNPEQEVAGEPDQNHDVVQFLQAPGVYFDTVATMAEEIQYYWDPNRVPPSMLQDLSSSLGYRTEPLLGVARNRELVAALRRSQGSLAAIERVVSGVFGDRPYRVVLSNNLMLDVSDSSFETLDASPSLSDTRWYPTSDTSIMRWDNYNGPIPGFDPNLLTEHYLSINSAGTRTFKCCTRNPDGTLNLPLGAVPISGWTVVRTGCYAMSNKTGTELSMGMDVYDIEGELIGSVTTLPPTTITTQWKPYSTAPVGNSGGGNGESPTEDLYVDVYEDIYSISWSGARLDTLYQEGEDPRHAYGVPWFTVSDASCIDLIVVDDG